MRLKQCDMFVCVNSLGLHNGRIHSTYPPNTACVKNILNTVPLTFNIKLKQDLYKKVAAVTGDKNSRPNGGKKLQSKSFPRKSSIFFPLLPNFVHCTNGNICDSQCCIKT